MDRIFPIRIQSTYNKRGEGRVKVNCQVGVAVHVFEFRIPVRSGIGIHEGKTLCRPVMVLYPLCSSGKCKATKQVRVSRSGGTPIASDSKSHHTMELESKTAPATDLSPPAY